MSVRVEFFGIPRQRAGTASVEVNATDLGTALAAAASRLPAFGAACLDGPRLRRGYIACVNGRAFVSDPSAPLASGDAVLVLSSDAGG